MEIMIVILAIVIIAGLIYAGGSFSDDDVSEGTFTLIIVGLAIIFFIFLFKEVAQRKVQTSVPAKIEYKITEFEGQCDTTYIYHFK